MTAPVMAETLHRLGAINANFVSSEYRVSSVAGSMDDDNQNGGEQPHLTGPN